MSTNSESIQFDNLTGEISLAREALRNSKQELNEYRALVNTSLEESSQSRTSSSEIDPELVQNQARLTEVGGEVESEIARLNELIAELVNEIDHTTMVENLTDQIPVLLLPVRVETRFMEVKHIVRLKTLLNPGGVDRDSASSVEEGMVLNQRLPVIKDKKELWIRIIPDDIHVHTHEPALTKLEGEAGREFWTNIRPALNTSIIAPYANDEVGYWRTLCSGRSTERAAWVARMTKPSNIIGTSPLVFPTNPQKTSSWTEAPHSKVMPDNFVARLYTGGAWREVAGKAIPDPLPLSIDPNTDEADYDISNGDLKLPDNLRWLEDFKEAEKIGMGIRVPVSTQEFANGFDKIMVLGVKSSADFTQSQALLEELIENHHYTSGGVALVPQGTPTNNTSDAEAGFTAYDNDAVVSYLTEMKDPLFTNETDDRQKSDGQHLAEALGIEQDVLAHVRYSDTHDIKEAMCMNRAIWPSSMGYYLKQMLFPIFDKPTIKKTREHFSQFVLGRGRVPAIRIDHQPYGIQPATAFSKWKYSGTTERENYLSKLHDDMLGRLAPTWKSLISQVQHASASSILPPEKFLDLITLHPASIEFYQRFSGGKWFLWNLFTFSQRVLQGSGPGLSQQITYLNTMPDLAATFSGYGFPTTQIPRIFNFAFLKEQKYLKGPVIDTLPLSETRSIKQIASTGKNYIEWLSTSNYSQILNEDFSSIGAPRNTPPPTALLYLMLRQSWLLEVVRSGIAVLVAGNVLSEEALLDYEVNNVENAQGGASLEQQAMLVESAEVEVAVQFEVANQAQVEQEFAQSRLAPEELATQMEQRLAQLNAGENTQRQSQVASLYQQKLGEFVAPPSKTGLLTESYPGLTNGLTLEAHIATIPSGIHEELEEMREVTSALGCLRDLPTARLERTFVESLDVCNYRMDSWMYSLVTERLSQQRLSGGGERGKGIYLGSFGWVENLVPSGRPGIAVEEVVVTQTQVEQTLLIEDDVQMSILLADSNTTESAPERSSEGENSREESNPESGRESSFEGETETVPSAQEIAESRNATLVSYETTQEITQGAITLSNVLTHYAIEDQSPKFIYLGQTGSNNIVYDPVQNKFITTATTDPNNKGYIHAPSINQATAAGILRAGYDSHTSINDGPGNENAMAVNLSSQRVRKAMFYIEGIRNGQELAALLGYQFERNLHDKHVGIDAHIYELRLLFPLVLGRVTGPSGNIQVRDGEAYNVVDGLNLIDAYRASGPGNLWYGSLAIPAADITKMETEIEALEDALDAISDLLLAESVFQASMGNAVKAGATLEAMARGGNLQELEILRTPRSSDTITQKIGLQFDLSANGESVWSGSDTPRSLAEPHLNRWIASLLPLNTKVCVNVVFTPNVPANAPAQEVKISMDQLGLEAIDLFALVTESKEPGAYSELSARLNFVLRRTVLAVDAISGVEVKYTTRNGFASDEYSMFELTPLFNSIRELILKSRPLSGEELLLNSEAEAVKASNPTKGVQTLNLYNRLNAIPAVMNTLTTNINSIVVNYGTNPATVTPSVLNSLRDYLLQAGQYNIPNSVPPSGMDFDSGLVAEMIELAKRVRPQLLKKVNEGTALLGTYASLATEQEKARSLEETAKALFGRSFKVYPEFLQYDPIEFERAKVNPVYLDPAQVGDFAIEEWVQGLAQVRTPIAALQRLDLMTEAVSGTGFLNLEIVQLPLVSPPGGPYVEKWLGAKFDLSYEVPGDNLSTLIQYPSSFDSSALQAGFLIDEWVEEIPHEDATTGISMHYNNPDTEAPQSMLLCVTPEETGAWKWNTLMDILDETLDWAKARAVDPDILKNTSYAHMLPTLIASISSNGGVPSLDFGRNNQTTGAHVSGPVIAEEALSEPNFSA